MPGCRRLGGNGKGRAACSHSHSHSHSILPLGARRNGNPRLTDRQEADRLKPWRKSQAILTLRAREKKGCRALAGDGSRNPRLRFFDGIRTKSSFLAAWRMALDLKEQRIEGGPFQSRTSQHRQRQIVVIKDQALHALGDPRIATPGRIQHRSSTSQIRQRLVPQCDHVRPPPSKHSGMLASGFANAMPCPLRTHLWFETFAASRSNTTGSVLVK